jgi:hypothetical protein
MMPDQPTPPALPVVPGDVRPALAIQSATIIEHPILRVLRDARREMTNDEVADVLGVDKSAVTKARAKLGRQIVERRDGRYVRLSVAG